MKSTKQMLLLALLLCMGMGLGNLFAQTRNDLLLIQDLENPNQSALMVQSTALHEAWREKGVLQYRMQHEGDASGSFRKIVDLDKNGCPLRKETREGETWTFSYDKTGSLRQVDEFKDDKAVASQYFYYERNGDLRKSVKSWPGENREVEGFYDKAGYLTRVRHSSKGITTKTVNIQYTWNDAKQLVGLRTPDLNATYLYNGGRLVQYRAQEVGKNTQVNIAYGDFGITEMKKYEEKDGDLILLETVSYEYNAAGLLARGTTKPRDPNASLVVKNFFYDEFEAQSVAMRGDDWDGGGYGYGTPVIISWSNPDNDARVTDPLYSLRLDLKPGVGQAMPEIKNLTLRLNQETTEQEIGHVVLRKEGASDKYYVEEKLNLAEGGNAIRLEVETELGKFASGERIIVFKDPNKEIKVANLHVLAIGVSDYLVDDLDLPSSANDLNALVSALTAQQGQLFKEVRTKVISDKDATKSAIEEAVRQIKGRAAKDDLVLIYFSGHGEELDGNFYLKPSDVKTARTELPNTAIDNRWMLEEISRYNASTLYFLDASHAVKAENSDIGKANMDEVTQDFTDVVTSDDDIRIFMSSTSAKQESRKKEESSSLYVSALLEGLEGKADVAGNNNGLVTVEELGAFVSDRVLGLTSWKQKPTQVKRGIGMVPIAKVKK